MKKILVVGGYGTVGSVVCELLAKDKRFRLIVSGRNEEKAKSLATRLQVDWRRLDAVDKSSLASSLTDVDCVVNCFSGPFTHTPLLLAEYAAEQGIHYLDVSGSYEYCERFLQLNDLAVRHRATLITALGANPGIPAVAVLSAQDSFDVLESAKIVFVLGAKMEHISIASLKELKYMLDVKPLIWKKPQWVKPHPLSVKEFSGPPFSKEVWMNASLTRDLLTVPELLPVDELSFWSGSQFTGQGLVMIVGLKIGLTRTDWGAGLLLNLLQRMGKKRDASEKALIRVMMTGQKNGVSQRRIIEMHGEENYLTALAPALVCQQLVENRILRSGAFVAPQVVPATDFLARLQKYPIHYSDTCDNLKPE